MKFLIILLLSIVSANAEYEKFHPAKTEAEKTLDMILHKQMKEEEAFYAFLTDFSKLESKNEKHEYYKFFTKQFVSQVRKMEQKLCNAETRKLPDTKCTIDVNPITRSADDGYLYAKAMAKAQGKQITQVEWGGRRDKVNFRSDIFLYRSYSGNGKKVFIEQTWAVEESQVTLFKMQKEDGKWKIEDATPR